MLNNRNQLGRLRYKHGVNYSDMNITPEPKLYIHFDSLLNDGANNPRNTSIKYWRNLVDNKTYNFTEIDSAFTWSSVTLTSTYSALPSARAYINIPIPLLNTERSYIITFFSFKRGIIFSDGALTVSGIETSTFLKALSIQYDNINTTLPIKTGELNTLAITLSNTELKLYLYGAKAQTLSVTNPITGGERVFLGAIDTDTKGTSSISFCIVRIYKNVLSDDVVNTTSLNDYERYRLNIVRGTLLHTHFDAIDNAGIGVHDETITNWKNLVTSTQATIPHATLSGGLGATKYWTYNSFNFAPINNLAKNNFFYISNLGLEMQCRTYMLTFSNYDFGTSLYDSSVSGIGVAMFLLNVSGQISVVGQLRNAIHRLRTSTLLKNNYPQTMTLVVNYNVLQLYYNTTLVSEVNTATVSNEGGNVAYIGDNLLNGGDAAKFKLHSFRVYRGAIIPSVISSVVNYDKTRFSTPRLVTYLDATQNKAYGIHDPLYKGWYDLSGNNNHAVFNIDLSSTTFEWGSNSLNSLATANTVIYNNIDIPQGLENKERTYIIYLSEWQRGILLADGTTNTNCIMIGATIQLPVQNIIFDKRESGLSLQRVVYNIDTPLEKLQVAISVSKTLVTAYVNGIFFQSTPNTHGLLTGGTHVRLFGDHSSTAYSSNVKIHSFRAYEGILPEEEILRLYNEDKVKYQ